MASTVGVEGKRRDTTSDDYGVEETREVSRAPSLGTTDDLIDLGDLPPIEVDPERLGRYEIVRRLGKGAMGTVFEALDPSSSTPLAIKSVSRLSPEALFRFKREFRALEQFRHPNVVSLYDLVLDVERRRLFFTMELIRGVDFITWLCGSRLGLGSKDRHPCRDYARLRDALRQLAEGVHAIHRAGLLHRDIKPSNVLVTEPQGRVVLLDFGLVRQHDDKLDMTDDGAVLGTPLYMSPEQAMGEREQLGPPSDWYCVGELLYQALTGRTAFQGKGMLALLAAKQEETPPTPSSLVEGVPEDLEQLCMDLLEREPPRRPTGDEVLQRISSLELDPISVDGVPKPIEAAVTGALTSAVPTLFLGRDAEAQRLHAAAAAARRGRPVVIMVHGISGMGKTALVQRFLQEAAREPDTVVLWGKCSERESIPYKALDSVMDALCMYLRGLASPAEVGALMPRDPQAVARLFPVLRSIAAVAGAPERDDGGLDPAQTRRRAFGALRELWGRIADRNRFIVHVDDLQWTDLDSAILLDAILRDADAPPMLFVGSYRTGADQGDAPLARLVRELYEDPRVDTYERIFVGPMSRTEAADLALRMLGGRDKKHRTLAEEVARESEGSPFFVGELVRYARRMADENELLPTDPDSVVSLDSVIRHRLAALPHAARRLLEVIAVAGGSTSQGVALSVAMGNERDRDVLAQLRVESLVRVHGSRDEDLVEIYHDRIRETAIRSIERANLAEIHLALGRALESSGDADAVALSHHFRQAGEDQRATKHTLDAAEQAEAALAFDRAAELYRAALDLRAVPADEVPELEARLAEALANAGRLYDSAQAYLRASHDGQDREHLEWTRRAADRLLSSGHSEEGRAVLQTVLESVGVSLPSSTGRAIASLLKHKASLSMRGMKYRLRKESEIPKAELEKLEACWTASRGLIYFDGIMGANFHLHHLRLALKCGEPVRLSRALATEAHVVAIMGADAKLSRALELIGEAEQLAERAGSASAMGFVVECRGHVWMSVGEWERAFEDLEHATAIFREQCTGMAQELSYCEAHGAVCLLMMGRIRELNLRAPRLLRESQDRANPYVEGYARGLLGNVVLLAPDRVEEAEAQLATYRDTSRRIEAHKLNYAAQTAALRRYMGDAEGAWAICEQDFPQMKKLSVLSAALAKAEFQLWRGACAVAGATAASDPKPLLAEALRSAARLIKHPSVFGQAYGYLTRAGAVALQGNEDAAVSDLRRAIELAEQRSMGTHLAAARERLATLVGGDEGREQHDKAQAYWEREGVLRPDRFIEMAAPGFVRRE
ncbi:serine/threonine-protein kinase [Paraliomyxa miuraensis]|uniref:serine/threonine-protein kinase n=1 Tax=Paraliomyxa miuraensis TaxID=376150 RepID=UPI002255A9B7|nr:serine/threonine-protein kinase [Paraliomyxa miuraensis]MCX4239268.1 protein kinase [Paraliomyxa miuraensis]